MEFRAVIERLRSRPHIPLFVVETWDGDVDQALRRAEPDAWFEGEPADREMARCALAGLHLWNDNFTESHHLCQGIQTATGSYWHALCHRREGHQGEGIQANLGNARYWFRQVGEHPAFDPVYRTALTVLDNAGPGFHWATEAGDLLRARRRWDPMAVIDWFAQADTGALAPQAQALLDEIQWREIDLLVDWCVQQALGQ